MASPPSLRWSVLLTTFWASGLSSVACDIYYFHRTHHAVRDIILRSVAAIACANFVSVAFQAPGLIGPRGILPLSAKLRSIESNLAYRTSRGLHTPISSRAMARLTVRLWEVLGGDERVAAAAWGGAALAAAVAFRPTSLGFAALYVVWYAYKRGLDTFANFQWDMLLLEALFLCAPLCAARSSWCVTVGVHCFRALALRLHCGAGCAKLTGGDVRWRDGTAMHVHHETQPLPTPLAPWFHALPKEMLSASTFVALALEMGVVVAVMPLSAATTMAFGMCVAVQVAIMLSGFYGYFNVLSIVLALSLLDDGRFWFWPGVGDGDTVNGAPPVLNIVDACVLLFAVGIFVLHLASAAKYAEGRVRWFQSLDPWLRTADHTFYVGNRYSLFTHMTDVPRREIVIEVVGGDESKNDQGEDDAAKSPSSPPSSSSKSENGEVEFRYKVGDCRRWKFVPLLHMPRLDWRLWLVAQGRHPLRSAPWLDVLLERLVDGSGGGNDVRGLFEPRRWRGDVRLRARVYAYRFAKRNDSHCPSRQQVWERVEMEGFRTKRE